VAHWQNAAIVSDLVTHGRVEGIVTLRQKDYAILDLMAGVGIAYHLPDSLNLRNVTAPSTSTAFKWGQAFYGASRSAVVSLNFES